MVTEIVPVAVDLTPLSLKLSATGEGVETGVVTPVLGDGGEPVPVPVAPHAAAVTTRAASATARMGLTERAPRFSAHLCTPALPLKVT